MYKERKCLFCGNDISHLQASAKFCSNNHRVQYYYKQKRLQEKKPLIAAKSWFQKNVSKAAIWFFLILVGLYVFPYAFSSGMSIIKAYQIEVQNDELKTLKVKYEELQKKTDNHDLIKIYLRAVVNPENGWMTEEKIIELNKFMKKDKLDISK